MAKSHKTGSKYCIAPKTAYNVYPDHLKPCPKFEINPPIRR